MIKRTRWCALSLGAILLLAGCSTKVAVGPRPDDIKVERAGYVASQNKSTDISGIVAFIDDLNTQLDSKNKIKDYSTTYDSDKDTYFVEAGDTTLAFKLDQSGNVLFASSAGGTMESRAALSKGMAQALGGTDSQMQAIFDKAEEQRWLNSVNGSRISGSVDAFEPLNLDATLPDKSSPNVPSMDTSLNQPTLDDVDMGAPKDLTDELEMPEANPFWDLNDAFLYGAGGKPAEEKTEANSASSSSPTTSPDAKPTPTATPESTPQATPTQAQ